MLARNKSTTKHLNNTHLIHDISHIRPFSGESNLIYTYMCVYIYCLPDVHIYIYTEGENKNNFLRKGIHLHVEQ